MRITKSTVILLFIFSCTFLNAQVRTTVLEKEQSISILMPGYTADQPDAKILPKVDVRKVLEEDQERDSQLPRFGVKIPVGFTERDGQWYELGGTAVWKMKVYSQRATALSFQFTNLHLPEGSEMWLYSESRNMVMGPILPEYVHNGILPTDQIFGEEVTIAVSMSQLSKEKFTIIVANVIHGIKRMELKVRDYGDSDGNCENNVNCSLGNGWGDERDAVCLILAGGTASTGTLLNSACQTIRPFILTANHFLADINTDPVGFWVFRFNYDSPSTICHGHQGEPNTWLSFNSANFLASWAETDFALVEMQSDVIGNSSITMAGWDRRDQIPNSTMGIHHPAADVKKISHDEDAPTIDVNPDFPTDDIYYRVIWDDGTTEGGSSGSALFDEVNKRVIGQLYGGTASCTNPNSPDFYGRFFDSWMGGGNNNNQLSHWLGGQGNPSTVNTIRVPAIDGTDAICNNYNNTYTLNNPLPGSSVSWSVTPTGLFSSSTSGSGSTATLKKTSSAHGKATLTFAMTGASCQPVVMTKTLLLGVPDYMELDVEDNQGNKILKTCETVSGETIYTGGDDGIVEYEWELISYNGSWDIESFGSLIPYRYVEIDYYNSNNPLPSTETVRIRARNACGWSWQQETYWTVEDHCNFLVKGGKEQEISDLNDIHSKEPDIRLRPTLAQSEVHIDWKDGYRGGTFKVSVLDRSGRIVKTSDKMQSNQSVLSVRDLSAGMYFMRIEYRDANVWKRFIVIQ